MTTMKRRPALVAIGGFAGTGTTTVARRLSSKLGFPCLGSDDPGQTIAASVGFPRGNGDAYWVGFDVLFRLGADFVAAGVSVIVDTNLGWDFHWSRLDAIRQAEPAVLVAPILLRCPLEVCRERIGVRHAAHLATTAPPDQYLAQP